MPVRQIILRLAVLLMANAPVGRHFWASEFACKCGKCRPLDIDRELVFVLDTIREYFDKPARVNSGVRCEDHNQAVGGSPKSYHLLGKAADIEVSGVDARDVQAFVLRTWPLCYGVGSYSNFTHIDVRSKKARW